ncbi:MAG TPA: alpha/beta fold hydrolase [Catenuloplanes sp.]|jgi:pimeloyl-ACP methyl ester carboxylesterase
MSRDATSRNRQPGRERVSRFSSAAARGRFVTAYDTAMRAWPQPRQEYDVQTGFGSVHVHRYGPASGVPIVLLHGAGGNSSNWYAQVGALGGHHPVYAVDTIDEPGRSIQRQPVTGSADNAAWLDETLAGLGLAGVHLVGHSYGGWLALNQAVYRPARLRSVTLLDPGGLGKVPVTFFLHLLAGALAMAAPGRTRPWLARKIAFQALFEAPDQIVPIRIAATTFRGARPVAARRFDDDELRAVRVPTQLLLAGRSSLLHPQRALARARNLIPQVRAEIVAGASHGLPLEQPALVNRRILDFVAGSAADDA